jgi:preprotein translocase subunit SecG
MAEVKADESAKAAGEKPADLKKKKPGNFLQKHSMIIAGIAAVVLVIFYFMARNKGSNANSQAAQNAQNLAAGQGINPSTGYLYGSPADIAALNGSGSVTATPGPQGPAGPQGPPGKGGPQGKDYQPISLAQARLLWKNGQKPYYYNISTGQYTQATNVHAGGVYYAGPVNYTGLRKGKYH